MSLYLCVFRGEEELDGVDVGSYEDFERLRDVARSIDGRVFRRFGILRTNVSPTTAWRPRAAARLEAELRAFAQELRSRPPRPFPDGSWQARVAAARVTAPATLYDCFFDVEGRPLVERLLALCRLSIETRQPILFQ
jgi:hypothetical protein